MVDAVLWDFGGVITTSPFEAFNRFERERGLPLDFIRSINAANPDDNAWALFERSEITLDQFDGKFREEATAAGHDVGGKDVIGLLAGDVRPRMLAALKLCKQNFKIGCITNNVTQSDGREGWDSMMDDGSRGNQVREALGLFDVLIESSKIGLRKPDPKIYAMMCDELAVDPKACVYLDDLGVNLKPARAMGMTTIKVVDVDQTLGELSAATGLTFT